LSKILRPQCTVGLYKQSKCQTSAKPAEANNSYSGFVRWPQSTSIPGLCG